MPAKNKNRDIQQDKQQQQQQQQQKSEMAARNHTDSSDSLDKAGFIRLISRKWQTFYFYDILRPLELTTILDELFNENQKSCFVKAEEKNDNRATLTKLQADHIAKLNDGIDRLLAGAKNPEYIAVLNLVKAIVSLAIVSKNYSQSILGSSDSMGSLDSLIDNEAILGNIFDLLVGNIVNPNDYTLYKKDIKIPFVKEGSTEVDSIRLLDSKAKISKDACEHLLSEGFDAMGLRFQAEIDYSSLKTITTTGSRSYYWSSPVTHTEQTLELSCPTGDVTKYLYFHDDVLRVDSSHFAKDAKTRAITNEQETDKIKAQGVFDKEPNGHSAWALLAMVKNDHKLRQCVSFSKFGVANDDKGAAIIKGAYGGFVSKHKEFISNIPQLWGQKLFDTLIQHIADCKAAINTVEGDEGDAALQGKILHELNLQLHALNIFEQEINTLSQFVYDLVGPIDDKTQNSEISDKLKTLCLESMFTKREKAEDQATLVRRVENSVALNLTGFADLKQTYEQEFAKCNKEEASTSSIAVLQRCLEAHVNFIFPLADIFTIAKGDFSENKFFEILGFNIFRQAFGKEYTLSQFKDFCVKSDAQILNFFTVMLPRSGSINTDNARQLVSLNDDFDVKDLFKQKVLASGLQAFCNSLAISGPEIAQQRMLNILENASKADKRAQVKALLGLKFSAMYFYSAKFTASAQGHLGREEDIIAGNCFPADVVVKSLEKSSPATCLSVRHDRIHNFIGETSLAPYKGYSYYSSNNEHDHIMACIDNSIGKDDPQHEAGAIVIAHAHIRACEYEYNNYNYYSGSARDNELALATKRNNEVFWTLAARVPGYDYTRFIELDKMISSKLDHIALSSFALQKLRHFVLESAMVDRDQEKTTENWEHILDAVASIPDAALANKVSNAANNAVNLLSDMGLPVSKQTFDASLYRMLDNIRFCSSYAMRVYFNAAHESFKQAQVKEAVKQGAANWANNTHGFEFTNLSQYMQLLHDNKVGNAFLNGATKINLKPFISKDSSGRVVGEEGFVAEEADRKAFFKRLDFFEGIYNATGNRSNTCQYYMTRIELELQQSLVRGTAINDSEFFEKMLSKIVDYNGRQQLDRGQQTVLAYCIDSAAKMEVAVDDELLDKFIQLSQEPDLYTAEFLQDQYQFFESKLRYLEGIACFNIKDFDKKISHGIYKECLYNSDVYLDGKSYSEDQMVEMLKRCYVVKLDSAAIDTSLNQIELVKAKGGVAAKDFTEIVNEINKAYPRDQKSQNYIDKIIRSIRVSGSTLQLKQDLIDAFNKPQQLKTHIKHLALEKLSYLVAGGVTESSLLNALTMLKNDSAGGLLTNFAEAAVALEAKGHKLPNNLLDVCTIFLSNHHKDISTPEAKISLATSFLLGYAKGMPLISTCVAEFNQLQEDLFDSLDEQEVPAFIKLDSAVKELQGIHDAYIMHSNAVCDEKQKVQKARAELEHLANSIYKCEDGLELENGALTKSKNIQSSLEAKIVELNQQIQGKKEGLQTQNSELNAKLKELKSRKNPETTEEKKALATEISSVKADIENLKTVCDTDTESDNTELSAAKERKEHFDTKVKDAETKVERIKTRLAELQAEYKACLSTAEADMPGVQARFKEQYDIQNLAHAKVLEAIDKAQIDIAKCEKCYYDSAAASQDEIEALRAAAAGLGESEASTLAAANKLEEGVKLKKKFLQEKETVCVEISTNVIGTTKSFDLAEFNEHFYKIRGHIIENSVAKSEKPLFTGSRSAASLSSSSSSLSANVPVEQKSANRSAASSSSGSSRLSANVLVEQKPAPKVSTIEFHMNSTKVLAKRTGSEKYLWDMVNNSLLSEVDLTGLNTAITHSDRILAEHLGGEANIIFTVMVKHYRSNPTGFVALLSELCGSRLNEEHQAMMLKLVYAYIENHEDKSLREVVALVQHLATNADKAELLGKRLIYPPYWSAADIMSKSVVDLQDIKYYDRVDRDYDKFERVAAKFGTLADDTLFAGTFSVDDKSLSFKDYLIHLDSKRDKSKLTESDLDRKRDKSKLTELQNKLTDLRDKFTSKTELPTEQEILDIVFTVTEILAKVSFDVNADGERKAKELRLEQIMSVFAWLKLGFSAKNSAASTIWNQVETGEGKSRITAVAAGAAAVLYGGKTIEMAFNSPYLALRGVEEFSFLFKQLFNARVETDIGVIADAEVSPAAYKKSSKKKQAVNFIATSEYLLASKSSDVALIKYLTAKDHETLKTKSEDGAVFLVDAKFVVIRQELISMGVSPANIKVTGSISKEIIACKALNDQANIVAISDKSFEDTNVTNITLGLKHENKIDFTDDQDDKGVIRFVDEADYGSNRQVPCNISSQGLGNGYWNSHHGSDGIYGHISEWAILKLRKNPSLLAASDLDNNDFADFKKFVIDREERNTNSDSQRIIAATLADLDLSKLQIWFESFENARAMVMNSDFILKDGYRGEHGEVCTEIVPLNEGGAAMPGSVFSNGVHQILRYLINSGQLKRKLRKNSIKDHFLGVFGWQIEDKLLDPDQGLLLAKPSEAPVVASKTNLVVLPEASHDARDSNVKACYMTSGTPSRQPAAAAGQQLLETPRANDLNREHLPTVFTGDSVDHVRAIVREVEQSKLDKRPAFILCKDEKESRLVYAILKKQQSLIEMSIQNYSSTLDQDAKEAMISKAGEIGTVTVGTIVDLGRGVDVKPAAEAKKNGGLHLVLTCLVEDYATYIQGVSRSGRNGDKGTVRVVAQNAIASEKTIASNRKTYNKAADIAQIQFAYNAPRKLFEDRIAEVCKSKKLSAADEQVINGLRAKLYAQREAKRHNANSQIQAAITKSWFKRIGLAKAEQILHSYYDEIVELHNAELKGKIYDNAVLFEDLKLSVEDEVFKDNIEASVDYLRNLKEVRVKTQKVPVAAEYDPSHAGQAVLYSNPLWFIDATLKGHNVIGDHIYALFRGGAIAPNLAAFLTLRTWPPVMAEVREYFRLKAGSNDAKVVNKSLLKIAAYSSFLGSMVAVPLVGSSLPILVPTVLVCSALGIVLYQKSTAIVVKEQAKRVDSTIIQKLLADNDKVDAELATTYIAPHYLRRASQILVYALFFAMVIGAYIACVPYFYSVYAAAVVASGGLAANYAWMQSYLLSITLMFGMYVFYTMNNKTVFKLPDTLDKDANFNLNKVLWDFGGYVLRSIILLMASYSLLAIANFTAYYFLSIYIVAMIGAWSSYFTLWIAAVILTPIVVGVLFLIVNFLKRFIKGEVKLSEIFQSCKSMIEFFIAKIIPIASTVQLGFMIYTGAFILLFSFPPVIILGANFVPLINVSILSIYAVCCVEQARYVLAQMFYLSPTYIKKAIISNSLDRDNKIEQYLNANKNTMLGKGLSFLNALRKRDTVYAKDIMKGALGLDTKDEGLVEEGLSNPRAEEQAWLGDKRNADTIYKHRVNTLLTPTKALFAGAAGFVAYTFVASILSSPLGLVLAAAAAIYVGIFVSSFVEDMCFNFAFGTKSKFAYLVLPEVAKAYKKKEVEIEPATDYLPAKTEEREVLTNWYLAKFIAQKTINLVLTLALSPVYFAITTIILPIKFISNLFVKDNSQIVKIQVANLLSFAMAVLFLFMTTSLPPLMAVCMSLYINSIVSFGMMSLLGVFVTNDEVNTFNKSPLSKGHLSDLFFGCNIDYILHPENVDGEREFNKWVDKNAIPQYVDDRGENNIYAPLSKITNFKGA